MHECHHCGAEAHAEIPFCKRCFGFLPKKHQEVIWKERQKTGGCGICFPGNGTEACGPGDQASSRWSKMCNLAQAILQFGSSKDCGGCEGPEEFGDSTGFCWRCGVQDPGRVYPLAAKIVAKEQAAVEADDWGAF